MMKTRPTSVSAMLCVMYMYVEEGGAEKKGLVRSLHSSTQDSKPLGNQGL